MVPNIAFPATSFVRALSRVTKKDVLNPWHDDYDDHAEARRTQLEAHLKCHSPRLLFLSDCSRYTDTNFTGVPMCCEDMALSGQVPRVTLPSRVSSGEYPISDCISADLWRGLAVAGLSEQSICFSLHPFLPLSENALLPSALLESSVWARQLIRWYRGIRVIAVGETVGHVLTSAGIDCEVIRVSGRGVTSIQSQLYRILLAPGAPALDRLPARTAVA